MPLDSTQEEARRIAREAFVVFEHKEGSKLVDEKDIPTIIRSMGINPTGTQLARLMDQLRSDQAEEGALIPLDRFELMQRQLPCLLQLLFMIDESPSSSVRHLVMQVVSAFALSNKNDLIRDDYHKLMRAFRALDPERKGYIDAELLSTIMSSRGEAFNAQETTAMLSCAAEAATGKVWYEDYAFKLATNGRRV